jgi:hypothetical protein
VWIRKIKSSTGNLKIVSFEDTISMCISYSNPKQAFEFGKQLLATGNQIKIPRRLTFQASDEEKYQLRDILGVYWTYFQRVASGLAEFVGIFTTSYALQFLQNISDRDLKNRTTKLMNEVKDWWQNEDKAEYPVNDDGKRLINAVVYSVLESSENGVEIFRNVCLSMQIHKMP